MQMLKLTCQSGLRPAIRWSSCTVVQVVSKTRGYSVCPNTRHVSHQERQKLNNASKLVPAVDFVQEEDGNVDCPDQVRSGPRRVAHNVGQAEVDVENEEDLERRDAVQENEDGERRDEHDWYPLVRRLRVWCGGRGV